MIKLADTHTHTCYSHDAEKTTTVKARVEKAIEKNLRAIAFTDHSDILFYHLTDIDEPINRSFAKATELKKEYDGRIEVLTGIELGEGIWHPEIAYRQIEMHDYDTVISSVHAVRFRDITAPFSTIKFDFWNEQSVSAYMDAYFDEVGENLEKIPTDILSHLTCPIRYITGRYGKEVDLTPFKSKIDDILRLAISKNIALEANVASMNGYYSNALSEPCPSEEIIKRYKELGGEMLTLASDAHKVDYIARNFTEMVKILKNIGFTKVCYFKNRKPVFIEI